MNPLPTFGKTGEARGDKQERRTLDHLFTEAESFGRLTISRMDDRPGKRPQYWARLEFYTIAGVKLRAEGQITEGPYETLEQMLEKAREIRGQFK